MIGSSKMRERELRRWKGAPVTTAREDLGRTGRFVRMRARSMFRKAKKRAIETPPTRLALPVIGASLSQWTSRGFRQTGAWHVPRMIAGAAIGGGIAYLVDPWAKRRHAEQFKNRRAKWRDR